MKEYKNYPKGMIVDRSEKVLLRESFIVFDPPCSKGRPPTRMVYLKLERDGVTHG